MSRGKRGFLSFVAALATVTAAAVAPVSAAETDGAVAGTDELAPEPVTNLLAFPAVSGVELSWDLSVSDVEYASPTGTDLTSGGSFVTVNDVAGYEIWRNGVLIDTAPAGATFYADELASGTSITYDVIAVDAAGNASEAASAIVSLGDPPVSGFEFDGAGPDIVPASIDCDAAAGAIALCSSVIWENTATTADAVLTVAGSVTGDGFVLQAELDATQAWATAYTMVIQPNNNTETLRIGFDPDVVGGINGTYTGVLTIRTNDPNQAVIEVPLSATVTGGLAPREIQVSRGEVSFGQLEESMAARTVQVLISNVGGLPLTVSTAFSEPSTVITASHLTDAVIEPGSSVVVGVSIDPSGGLGQQLTNLVITSDDPVTPEISLPVTGTVVTTIKAPSKVVAQVVRQTVRFPVLLRTPSLPSFSLDAQDPVAVNDFISSPAKVTERAIFRSDFRTRVANIMQINRLRIINIVFGLGSLKVTYDIAEPEAGSTEPSASEAATAVETVLADTTTTNELSDIGTTDTQVESATVQETLFPQDSEGTLVLGWFSRAEDQVGLSDFFLFADNYGKSSGGADFDDTYDIAPVGATDGVVGLEDFFVFADNYGKTVENAAAIRAYTP